MSLLDDSMEECTMLDHVSRADGYGSMGKVYVDGAPIMAAIALDNSTTARIAEKDGVLNLYTVYVKKNVLLEKPDVFRRNSDGKVFKVTSDGKDDKTPKNAPLDLRKVSAQEWKIPEGEYRDE